MDEIWKDFLSSIAVATLFSVAESKLVQVFASFVKFCLICWLCFFQDNVGRREVDAADCKTVYLSEYAIPSNR